MAYVCLHMCGCTLSHLLYKYSYTPQHKRESTIPCSHSPAWLRSWWRTSPFLQVPPAAPSVVGTLPVLWVFCAMELLAPSLMAHVKPLSFSFQWNKTELQWSGGFLPDFPVHHRLGCLPAGGLNRLSLKRKSQSVLKYVLEAVSPLKEAFQTYCVCWLALCLSLVRKLHLTESFWKITVLGWRQWVEAVGEEK